MESDVVQRLKQIALRNTSQDALHYAKLLDLELPVNSWLGVLTVEEVELYGKKVYVIVRYYTLGKNVYRRLLWVEDSIANSTPQQALRKIESLVHGSKLVEDLVTVSVNEDGLRSRS